MEKKHPRDVGRTSGGGSLGHAQPKDVTEQGPIRNQPEENRERRDEIDPGKDPVMPADDSTLRTKI